MYVVYYLFAGKHANIKKKQGRERWNISLASGFTEKDSESESHKLVKVLPYIE